MGKFFYKLLAFLAPLLGGMVASAIFKRIWKFLPGQEQAPAPTDEERSLREVLPAAALQGAITAGVRASVKRGNAAGFRRVTGTWPA
ncbi:DUF4235 domain-containing protein [Streptomyces pathocidini]|uniref:DUF4235 domain-containing protein n=1 Tax=Streptomyces pathocidini TaxID=1650571 RepID=A0ABW7UNK5_9ACTN|nr:DUF4235 domain-containing protein [Streptomyces pathocidini]